LLNLIGKWIQGHDAYEVQNFETPGVSAKTSNNHLEKLVLVSSTPTVNGSTPAEGRFWLFGFASTGNDVWVSNSGQRWVLETTFSLSGQRGTDADTDGTGAHILVTTHGGVDMQTRISGVWGTLMATGMDHTFCVTYSPAYSAFYCGAEAGAGVTPKIGKVNQALTTFTAIAITKGTGYPAGSTDENGVQAIACNIVKSGGASVGTGNLIVAAAGNATGSPQGLATWHSSDGATFALVQIATAQKCMELFWDDSQQLFYLVAETGHLFSSPDGAVWTDTGTVIQIDTSKQHTFAVYGSIWTAVLNNNVMAYSVDQGAHWTTVPHPFTCDSSELPTVVVQRVVQARDGRMAALGQALIDTGAASISWSGRAI
jgi:hypothetical protein